MRRFAAVAVSSCFLVLFACQDAPVAPTADEAANPTFAKGGNPGKPGGGGPPTPADPAIAYITGDFELWVMNADGSNRTHVLTPADVGANVIRNPAWSPAIGGPTQSPSYTIVFTNAPPGLMTVELNVSEQGNISVGPPQLLTTGVENPTHPAYSPDGSTVALIGIGRTPCVPGDPLAVENSIYIVDAGGGVAKEVYCSPAFDSYGLGELSWSPDGTAIAFAGNFNPDGGGSVYGQEIRICNLVAAADGTPTCHVVTAVSQGEGEGFGSPDWSHDGSTLLFNQEDYGAAHRKTQTCSVPLVEGASGWQRVAGSAIDCLFRGIEPSWSPDDSEIVVTGVSVYDAVTLRKVRRLDDGIMPDWRGPAPTAP